MSAKRIGDHDVLIGGLMRCCTQTLVERAQDPMPHDHLLHCNYEKGKPPTMRFDVHAKSWRWANGGAA